MRKHFKKFFVPHKHNQYHPHLFRNVTVLSVFAVSAFLLGVSYGNYVFLRETVLGANIATNVLIDMANENRVQNSIEPLAKNDKLTLAAQLKADDMIENNYFAHFAPDGTTPWYFINQAGYDFLYAGENLAINFTDSKQVDEAWMNSPAHRANLLNSNFKEVGIATKLGPFENATSVYVVQMFGTSATGFTDTSFVQAPSIATETPQQLTFNQTQDKQVEKQPEQLTTSSQTIDVPDKQINKKPKITSSENVKVIQENKNFIAVKSQTATGTVLGVEKDQPKYFAKYSTWLDRFIFDSPFYIQYFYVILIIIITFGMLLRMIIEYRRQHIKHLIISGLFLLATVILAIVNLNFVNFL